MLAVKTMVVSSRRSRLMFELTTSFVMADGFGVDLERFFASFSVFDATSLGARAIVVILLLLLLCWYDSLDVWECM